MKDVNQPNFDDKLIELHKGQTAIITELHIFNLKQYCDYPSFSLDEMIRSLVGFFVLESMIEAVKIWNDECSLVNLEFQNGK